GCHDDASQHRAPSRAVGFGRATGVIVRPAAADTIAPALAALAGESVEQYWPRRLDGKPRRLTLDFIQPSQLAVGNGQEVEISRFPIVVTGQNDADASLARTHLDRLRAAEPDIAVLAYHVPFEDQLPLRVGPGFDVLRGLQESESAYLHDHSGNRLYVTDEAGTRALFDPRSEDVRAALMTAVAEILAAYPYDGIYLDNYRIRDEMLLDIAGNQYTGGEGPVVSEADRAAKLAALETLAQDVRRTWPMLLVVANRDGAMARHATDALGRGGWLPSGVNYTALQWDGPLATLSNAQVVELTSSAPAGLLVHVVQAISGDRILPDTRPIPGRRTDTVVVRASRGEFEAASFVIRAPAEPPGKITVVQSDLRDAASGALIPADAIDVRFVKPWYQGFRAWNEHWTTAADNFRQILVPELLLKDDDLVVADPATERNLLKLQRAGGPEYATVNVKQLSPDDKVDPPAEEFSVRDASVQQPFSLARGVNKQVWVTVHVPEQARAGRYVGTIDLRAGGRAIASLPVVAEIHPFGLAIPRITYSMYYTGRLSTDGPHISSDFKSAEQMRSELQDLKAHGVTQPTMVQHYTNVDLLKEALNLRREVGLNRGALYYLGITTTASDLGALGPAAEATLRGAVPRLSQLAADAGFDALYVYGRDEAKGSQLTEQRRLWQVTHELGARVFVAADLGANALVGDLLDTPVIHGNPDDEEVRRWHASGKKIFSYANPQTGPENPYLFRLNYGLLLWANDYDGAMPYAYQDCFGSCWNDLDHAVYRDHNLTYPTVDGVIPTLAWEGMREGIDDVRYVTTLENALARNPADAAAVTARAFLSRLKAEVRTKQKVAGLYNQNMGLDLDEVRSQVVALLTDLGAR
ncbi:MAG: hypothetical protein ABIX37_02640, partial [Gammaproteobacteria bacterium]